jgi:hypothetical protein
MNSAIIRNWIVCGPGFLFQNASAHYFSFTNLSIGNLIHDNFCHFAFCDLPKSQKLYLDQVATAPRTDPVQVQFLTFEAIVIKAGEQRCVFEVSLIVLFAKLRRW